MKDKETQQAKKDQKIQILTFVFFGLIILFLHTKGTIDQNDDVWFAEQLQKQSLFSFLHTRYETWTSRLLIEAVLVEIVTKNVWVWRILDTLMMLLACVSYSKIVLPKGMEKWTPWIVVPLFLVPVETLSSAGFAATTINYVWPAACMLYGLLQSVKRLRGEQEGMIHCVLGILAILFAANMEQVAAVLAGVFLVLLILFWWRDTKVEPYTLLVLIVTILEIIFALTCPGNTQRTDTEIYVHFNDYQKMGIFEKLQMGFLTQSVYYFVTVPKNYVMIYFYFVLCFLLWKQKKWISFLVQIPGVIFVLYNRGFGFLKRMGIKLPEMKVIGNIYPSSLSDFSPQLVLIEEIIFVILWVLLFYGTYRCAKTSFQGLVCTSVLAAGFLSRLMMGFSPSIYASGFRTALIMTLSFIMTAAFLFRYHLQQMGYCKKVSVFGTENSV